MSFELKAIAQTYNTPAVYTSIEQDGKTLASVFLIMWTFEIPDRDGELIEVVEVRDLCVASDRRGEGLGRSLMTYCLANQADKPIMLAAAAFDDGLPQVDLVAWYQRLGFEMGCPFMDGDGWMWKRPTGKAADE